MGKSAVLKRVRRRKLPNARKKGGHSKGTALDRKGTASEEGTLCKVALKKREYYALNKKKKECITSGRTLIGGTS